MRNTLVEVCVATVAIAGGVIFFLYSDGGILKAPSSAATETHPVAVAVSFINLASGTQSSVPTRTNYLITSTSELDKLWKMIDAKGNPPAVDFTSNSIVASFAGTESAVGTISIAKIEDTSVRMVTVALALPGSGCSEKNSIAPYVLVEVPKTSLTFTHQDIATTTSCSR